MVAVAMVIVGVYVLYLAQGIVTPFVLGALLVLVLKPIIDLLHSRAVPVVASARVVFLYIRAKLLDEDPFPKVEPGPERPSATTGSLSPLTGSGPKMGGG